MNPGARDENPGARDDDRSIDERFADIVANWDATPPPRSEGGPDPLRPGEATGPAAPTSPRDPLDVLDVPYRPSPPSLAGADDAAAAGAGEDPPPEPHRQLPPPPASGWRVHVPPQDDEDERYIPPAPAPLPRHDWTFWGALTGLVAGPLWLLYLVVVERAVNRSPMWLAGGLIVAGFGLLVARLPARRDPDDDDDGARV